MCLCLVWGNTSKLRGSTRPARPAAPPGWRFPAFTGIPGASARGEAEKAPARTCKARVPTQLLHPALIWFFSKVKFLVSVSGGTALSSLTLKHSYKEYLITQSSDRKGLHLKIKMVRLILPPLIFQLALQFFSSSFGVS